MQSNIINDTGLRRSWKISILSINILTEIERVYIYFKYQLSWILDNTLNLIPAIWFLNSEPVLFLYPPLSLLTSGQTM